MKAWYARLTSGHATLQMFVRLVVWQGCKAVGGSPKAIFMILILNFLRVGICTPPPLRKLPREVPGSMRLELSQERKEE